MSAAVFCYAKLVDWSQSRSRKPRRRRPSPTSRRPRPRRRRQRHGGADDRAPGRRISGSSCCSCCTARNTVRGIFAGLIATMASSSWSTRSPYHGSGGSTRNDLPWTTKPWDELWGNTISTSSISSTFITFPDHASLPVSASPLSPSITPALFHSRLKTFLFHKSYPPSIDHWYHLDWFHGLLHCSSAFFAQRFYFCFRFISVFSLLNRFPLRYF